MNKKNSAIKSAPAQTLHRRVEFLKRLKKIYGGRVVKPSGAKLLEKDRDRY